MGEAVRVAHAVFAWVAITLNLLAGIWGLAALRWPPLRGRRFWLGVVVAEGALAIQVLLGFALIGVFGHELSDNFHAFYGVVIILTIALAWIYKGQVGEWKVLSSAAQRELLLYGLVSLFLMGLGIRGALILLA